MLGGIRILLFLLLPAAAPFPASSLLPTKGVILADRWLDPLDGNSWVFEAERVLRNELGNDASVDLVIGMDIYASNTKRFEKIWLNHMENNLCIDARTLAIGHRSGADALLRYAERRPIGSTILIGAGDIFHAAERHGRDYLWSSIAQNIGKASLVYGQDDEVVSVLEGRKVQQGLGVPDVFFCVANGGEGSFRQASHFPEVTTMISRLISDYVNSE
jgi:hypothetical protein